ncbi:hypothetical protein BDV93DRAFT_604215 [Ceratobasidium sp. AG-I]|nr:hypothetical protein BDV93DRAFT_604215 [Ceratobasidium sp. AG-I]
MLTSGEEGKAEESINGLGTIKLVLQWKRLTERVSKSLESKVNVAKRIRLLKVPNESLLKSACSTDAVGLGRSRPESTHFGVWFNTEVAGLDAITFVFHYARRGLLEANGIIPIILPPTAPRIPITGLPRIRIKRRNSHREAEVSQALKTARELNALANYIPAKRQRVKSEPDSAIRLPHLAAGPYQALLDDVLRLNNRAEELNAEIQSRPMFSGQKRHVDADTVLQDRVLILELSQLVSDFQRLIKKLQVREKGSASEDTPPVRTGTDSLDGDEITVGKLAVLQTANTSGTQHLDITLVGDEASKLNRRANELDWEVQNQSTIGQRDGSANKDASFLNRMLILELGRLIRDLQNLCSKVVGLSAGELWPKGEEKG